jgi:hypothetical protein
MIRSWLCVFPHDLCRGPCLLPDRHGFAYQGSPSSALLTMKPSISEPMGAHPQINTIARIATSFPMIDLSNVKTLIIIRLLVMIIVQQRRTARGKVSHIVSYLSDRASRGTPHVYRFSILLHSHSSQHGLQSITLPQPTSI